jgi:CBS domain-containing protein
MKCSTVMKTDVACCRSDDSVTVAAKRMKTRNVGFLPVCDEAGAVLGTVTDRDLALRVLADHRPSEGTTAQDVMTPELICCSPEDELEVAEELMAQYRKSRIVCADDHRRPVGVISLSDLARVEDRVKATEILDSVTRREASPA